jgi:RES domain-containing protein
MHLFRVSPVKFARDTSGEGARLYGARWNPKGIPVLYTATTGSLAVLESLVHASQNEGPVSRVLVTYELPDTVSVNRVELDQLPAQWSSNPPPSGLATIGKGWADQGKDLVLLVPSAVLPFGDELNALVNPRHPDFDQLQIVDVRPYLFDERLLKS